MIELANELNIWKEKYYELLEKYNRLLEEKNKAVIQYLLIERVSKFSFYLDLVEYFFYSEFKFRAAGIDKTQIRNDDFGQSYNDFYYKMYYILLHHQVETTASYNTPRY